MNPKLQPRIPPPRPLFQSLNWNNRKTQEVLGQDAHTSHRYTCNRKTQEALGQDARDRKSEHHHLSTPQALTP